MKKKATCGTCKFLDPEGSVCVAGFTLQYPLMVTEHECPAYEYDPSGEVIEFNEFNRAEFPECDSCANQFRGVCDGKLWLPVRRAPICEFYRPAGFLCKFAEPYLGYRTSLRNNYCSKFPSKSCPFAHRHNRLPCYEPRVPAEVLKQLLER